MLHLYYFRTFVCNTEMIKRGFNIVISVAIVLLLLLNGTSHDFIHLFSGHTDTVDCAHGDHNSHETYFEQEHHHCHFLDLEVPLFLHPEAQDFFFIARLETPVFILHEIRTFCPELPLASLRGPPAVA